MKKIELRKIFAATISIVLHLSIFFLSFVQENNSASTLSVNFISTKKIESPKTNKKFQSTKANPNINSQKNKNFLNKKSLETSTELSTQNLDTPQDLLEKNPETISEQDFIDLQEKNCENSEIFIDLPGWDWDFLPEPLDNTQEIGFVTFEISVDQEGYIVGIQTLDKNVSTYLEELYKKSLENLTFSKKSSNSIKEKITKGKITFFINAKN